MKRLLLLRHAKASQDVEAGGDHARELTARGRKDASAMGAFLQAQGLIPNMVLCSSAARTVETWELVARELGAAPKVEFRDLLYLASAKKIQSFVRAADDAPTLLVIGHNPGMEDCATALARKPRDKDETARAEQMKTKFATCALALLEFDIARWKDIAAGTGVLVEFIAPKDISIPSP
jgi:phosphohistidine phosphatase